MRTSILPRLEIEMAEEWEKIAKNAPFIQFPGDWKISIIPPWAGACMRFRVELPSGTIKSVFADFHCRLGFYGNDKPYWEVHPFEEDIGRCGIDDVDELLRMIGDES